MVNFKSFKYLYMVVICAALIFAFFLIKGNNAPTGLNSASEVFSEPVAKASHPEVLSQKETIIADKKVEEPVNRIEVRNWFESRGYYDFSEPGTLDDYAAYDIDTLTKLSETGDLKAFRQLALMQDSVEGQIKVSFDAAVHGSTSALTDIFTATSLTSNFDGKNEDEKKKVLLDAISYLHAAHLRGDSWGLVSAGRSMFKSHPFELDQSDVDYINQRGAEIYTKLQEERNILGLGSFDNSINSSADKYVKNYARDISAGQQNIYFKSIFGD